MIGFAIDIEESQQIPIIRVKGEVDVYTCPRLNDALTDVVTQGKTMCLLNLDRVQYVDSTGLGTIAHSARALSKHGGKIHVVCSKPQIKKIFEISGLVKKNIYLFEDEAEALKTTQEA